MALGSLICGLSKHVPDEFMVISFSFKSYLLQHNVPFWITVPIRVKKDESVKSTHLFYTVYALNTSINISLQRL